MWQLDGDADGDDAAADENNMPPSVVDHKQRNMTRRSDNRSNVPRSRQSRDKGRKCLFKNPPTCFDKRLNVCLTKAAHASEGKLTTPELCAGTNRKDEEDRVCFTF